VSAGDRPRIAFLLSSLKFGGAERVALNLALAFKRQGYAIDFVLMQKVGELLEEAERHFTVIDLDCSRTWKLPGKLAGYMRRDRPVAVISSFWKLNLCACIARISAPRVKLGLWEHSPPSRSRNSPTWLYFITASLFYRLATRVIAVSDGVAEDIRRISVGIRAKIVTIYNAIPPPQPGAAGQQRQGRRIIWVGRFADPKNPGLMIEAFARLPSSGGYVLEFLGDGPLRSELEEQARRSKVSKRIKFLGFQTDVYSHMEAADLLVLSSDREGLGNVLIEALWAGLGVVSTDAGAGIREILLDNCYGTIVPVGDAQALAAAIERELANPRDRDTQRQGAARFDPDLVVRQFADAIGLG
jgi:glycosyltransferase involved in cell wall biosynthesis